MQDNIIGASDGVMTMTDEWAFIKKALHPDIASFYGPWVDGILAIAFAAHDPMVKQNQFGFANLLMDRALRVSTAYVTLEIEKRKRPPVSTLQPKIFDINTGQVRDYTVDEAREAGIGDGSGLGGGVDE